MTWWTGGPAGGHWLNAYPFVRLHTPSAYYGVDSLPLGEDRIDRVGENAGLLRAGDGRGGLRALRRRGLSARRDGTSPHARPARAPRSRAVMVSRFGTLDTGEITRSRCAARSSTLDTWRRRSRPPMPLPSKWPGRPDGARQRPAGGLAGSLRLRGTRLRERQPRTHVSGCSTTASSRSGSAGSARATPGSTTAATSSRWSRSARSWRGSPSMPRPAPRRRTSTGSSSSSRAPGGSCASTPRGRQRCIAARC